MNLLSLSVILLLVSSATLTDIDLKKTVIWGPGLGQVSLPVRYFFLQLVNKAGENFTESQGIEFDIELTGESKTSPGDGKCRGYLEQFDSGDGSIVVRFRIYQECRRAILSIQYEGQHVAESPYSLPGTLLPETCSCPLEMKEFLKVWKCSQNYPQIDFDLAEFSSLNYTRIRRKMLKKYSTDHPGSLAMCQYAVKSGEVFRKCFGKHVGFNMFMDATLLSLGRKVKLPDFEVFVNLGDWPMSAKTGKSRTPEPWPIFSWCGSEDSYDIVMPTYDLTESSLEAMNRVTLDILSVQKSQRSWSEKIPMGFFRGRDARRERLRAVELARMHPDLLNVSMTNFFFFRDEQDKYGPKVPHVSFFEFFHHKYQINIDGTVASYRFPYLLAGDSVVLKQDSPYYEHFYYQLSPMVHYIPFKRDLSDLVDKIRWARDHDEEVREISRKARSFVREHLLPSDIFCYYVLLFQRWSELTHSYKVSIPKDMDRVTQPDGSADCSCTKNPHDEL
ncbi:KDEL motif-containing protein 1 [Sergentomyia squamirostris]